MQILASPFFFGIEIHVQHIKYFILKFSHWVYNSFPYKENRKLSYL